MELFLIIVLFFIFNVHFNNINYFKSLSFNLLSDLILINLNK